jgi:hypothetical protein
VETTWCRRNFATLTTSSGDDDASRAVFVDLDGDSLMRVGQTGGCLGGHR